jgi:hypothetical protein
MKTQIINAKTGEVEVRDMTSAETEKHNQVIEDTNKKEKVFKDERINKETIKTSGKAKLKALGLTDAEIGALKI